MDKPRDVVVIVGSLRKGSINRKVANALAELAPAALKLSIIEIGHLPIYNQDGDDNPPAEWLEFRERIRAADAVLFITPEHNRSVPAALKNALDIGSRPYGKSAWSGKPGGVVSANRVLTSDDAFVDFIGDQVMAIYVVDMPSLGARTADIMLAATRRLVDAVRQGAEALPVRRKSARWPRESRRILLLSGTW